MERFISLRNCVFIIGALFLVKGSTADAYYCRSCYSWNCLCQVQKKQCYYPRDVVNKEPIVWQPRVVQPCYDPCPPRSRPLYW